MVNITSTIGNSLRSYARFHPAQEALVSPGFRISYQEYESLTNQYAHYLLEQGVKKGDRVSLLIGVNASYPLSLMSLAKIGAIAVPISYHWKQELIHWALDHVETNYILVEDQYCHFIQDYIESKNIRSIIVCNQHKVSSGLLEKLKGYPTTPPDIEVKPEDPCTIIFTSGTTGKPKGVVTSHNAFFAGAITGSTTYLMHSRQLFSTPTFHMSAAFSVYTQSYLGISLIYLPELSPESLLETIEKERINCLILPPNLLSILLPIIYKSDYTLSSLKRFISGGTKVPESIIRDYKKLGFEVVQAYGATELTGPISCWNPKFGYDKIRTVGKVYLLPEVKILDPETREELPPGEVGEVAVRSPQLFTEYWKNPEETKKAFYQGWFLTGDAGRIDEQGFIEIVDRYKDVIFFSGFGGIFPGEIEDVIREMEEIEDVSVAGIHHPKWAEFPCA
ncbi:MAG: AMP-binding protein, partial [Thermoactinomyces sp.]